MANGDDATLFIQNLNSLWDNEEYADFSIIYGSEGQYSKRVHRAVICSRSEWFKNLCKRNFKEGQLGEVDLTEDDPCVVEAMLKYIYRADYASEDPEGIHNLVFHARVYAMAERIFFTPLKEIAIRKIQASFKTEWDEVDFMEAVRVVYESTYRADDALRQIMLAQAYDKKDTLFADETHKATLEQTPGFATDLVYMGIDRESRWHLACAYCQTVNEVKKPNKKLKCRQCGRKVIVKWSE